MLLRLYPKAWRERYEAEMKALLDEHDVTLSTRFDLLRGAWDAWTRQGEYSMTSLPAAALRGARLGLIPALVPFAGYLLSLDINTDANLLNLLGKVTPPSLVLAVLILVCLWAGKREAERASARGGSVVAGAAAGVVGLMVAIHMNAALLVGDIAFGISSHVIALQGGSISYGHTTAASMAAWFVNPTSLLVTAISGVVGIMIGAALGAIGTALRGLRVTRKPSSG